jgi:hypothetical protein
MVSRGRYDVESAGRLSECGTWNLGGTRTTRDRRKSLGVADAELIGAPVMLSAR